jgi:hypothetical protein
VINATGRLFGLLRAFFEQEMRSLGTWDDVTVMEGELAERERYNRRNRYGDHKEIAAVTFRGYEITAISPFEAPPVGRIECRRGDLVESGPLDDATWKRLGKFIRENEAVSHGD